MSSDQKRRRPAPATAQRGAKPAPSITSRPLRRRTVSRRKPAPRAPAHTGKAPRHILSIDVGGSGAKFLLSGRKTVRRIKSGKHFTPTQLVRGIQAATPDWKYDAIALGFPARVGEHGALANPENLGRGWVGFDFGQAFGVPVRIINDAAMQALGSYEGGRMLFLGLGTGLGSTLVSGGTIVSLELGRLPLNRRTTLGEQLGKAGLKHRGRKRWERLVHAIVPALQEAVMADYVVIGGGNARKLKSLPPKTHRGHNDNAIHGGFRLWDVEGVPLHSGRRRRRGAKKTAKMSWRSV